MGLSELQIVFNSSEKKREKLLSTTHHIDIGAYEAAYPSYVLVMSKTLAIHMTLRYHMEL